MTLTELSTKIATLNLPYTYGLFPNGQIPTLPYIEYQESYSSNFGADNYAYQKIKTVDIFLFTSKKDTTTEASVETLLDNNKLFFNKTETYLDDERVYQIIYEVKING